jgi:hypothetical protein
MFWMYEMMGRCVFQFCMFLFYLLNSLFSLYQTLLANNRQLVMML